MRYVSDNVSLFRVTQVPRGMERFWEGRWPDWRPRAMGPVKSWRAWRQAASRSGSSEGWMLAVWISEDDAANVVELAG